MKGTPAATDALAVLGRTWREEIPISDAMGIRPVAFADHSLTVEAELAPNVNVHGTAFAGSLYAIAALSGWGLVHLELQAAGLAGAIVIADGAIRYRAPVQQTIRAVSSSDASTLAEVLAKLRGDGRARWPLSSVIEVGSTQAVRFDGTYAIRLEA